MFSVPAAVQLGPAVLVVSESNGLILNAIDVLVEEFKISVTRYHPSPSDDTLVETTSPPESDTVFVENLKTAHV